MFTDVFNNAIPSKSVPLRHFSRKGIFCESGNKKRIIQKMGSKGETYMRRVIRVIRQASTKSRIKGVNEEPFVVKSDSPCTPNAQPSGESTNCPSRVVRVIRAASTKSRFKGVNEEPSLSNQTQHETKRRAIKCPHIQFPLQ